jgi:short-subunit dehydrogenase
VQLEGAVVIITGASRGIGAATASLLVAAGATVIGVGHEERELEESTARTGAIPYAADVRDPKHADALVDAVLAEHGRLDAVVANAGIGHAGPFSEMTIERVDDLIAVNVRAPILLARAALPAMLARTSGAVVLVSSIAGALVVPGETVYSATKAAIEAFAEALREEVRGSGVGVSTVLPTVVETGFFTARGAAYHRKRPKPLRPEAIAEAIARCLRDGDERLIVPPALAVPVRLRGIAPTAYRALARRFG